MSTIALAERIARLGENFAPRHCMVSISRVLTRWPCKSGRNLDFRRRQREEREAADKPGKKHLTTSFDRPSVSPALSVGRDRAVLRGSEPTSVSRRASVRRVSHRSTPLLSQSSGESSFLSTTALPPLKFLHDVNTFNGDDFIGERQYSDVFPASYLEVQQLECRHSPHWMYCC